MDIKTIVKDNRVTFLRYRKDTFYYGVTVEGQLYSFPVPVADIGDATLEAEDSAMLFMRYIRKALADNTFVPIST